MKTKNCFDKELDSVFASFFISSVSNSFIRNSDGDGIYFSYGDTLIKNENKINLIPYIDKMSKSNVIISHQRLATHGKTQEYIQPFDEGEFILAHNGVLWDYVYNDNSDTYNFFENFLTLMKHLKGSREDKIINSIKSLLDKSDDRYSIVIYDKKTKSLYYFKSENTNIKVYRDDTKESFYITTEKENWDFLYQYFNGYREIDISDNKIYKFAFRGENTVRMYYKGKIEKPEKKVEVVYSNEWEKDMRNFPPVNINLGKTSREITEDFKNRMRIVPQTNPNRCEGCGEYTHQKSLKTGQFFCSRCQSEEASAEWIESLDDVDSYGKIQFNNSNKRPTNVEWEDRREGLLRKKGNRLNDENSKAIKRMMKSPKPCNSRSC